MPDFQDPFLDAAVRLGFLKENAARKAEQESQQSRQEAETWLLGRGILTPREVERIKPLAGLGRRATTRSGARIEKSPAGGLAVALIGFVLVLGGGLYLFKDRIFPPEPVKSATKKAESPTGSVAPEPEENPHPAPTGPEKSGEPDPEPEPTGPEKPGEPDPEPEPTPPKKVDVDTQEKPEKPPRKPGSTGRDPKVLKAADAAFVRGEKWNREVGAAGGQKRTDLMVKALEAFTEALAGYRKYAGHRVPQFLEKRYAEVNSRVALLRKLLPPEKAAKFIRKLTGQTSTAGELLSQAQAACEESPLNHTMNYMLFQRVLDEHPGSREALVALRRIGEIGWLEIEAVNHRRSFMRETVKWQRAMAKGKFQSVKEGLRRVNQDKALRGALRSAEWAWYLTTERALRVPAAVSKNITKGEMVTLKKRSGRTVRGRVTEVLSVGVRIEGGKFIPVGDLHPDEVIRVAFDGRKTGARMLTLSCFMAFMGHDQAALSAMADARKRGTHIEDYEPVIKRLLLLARKKG